jgi:DNA-binding winged helix-turn-helix (wHTH) protein/Tol biopolymer transport system component
MLMPLETKRLGFGEFQLDLEEMELRRNGERLSVNPKTFQLLLLLLEHQGRLVTKEQLMEALWPEAFVEEANLAFTVSLLRKALGDDAKNPRYVETVPRRGYRFIAEVRETGVEKDRRGLSAVVAPAPRESEPESKVSPIQPRHGSSGPLAAVVAIADWQSSGERGSADRTGPAEPIAKLELVRPSVRGRREIAPYLALGSIFVLGLAVLAYITFRPSALSGKPSGIRTLNFKRLTTNGITKSAAVSPDGRFVAYTVGGENGDSLWLKNTAGGGDVSILQPSQAGAIAGLTFWPDGNHVSYSLGGTLYRLPILGGIPKPLLENFGFGKITFSPDGQRFAFIRHLPSNEASIVIANSDGSQEQIVSSSKPPNLFIGSPAWSPDGSVIAAVSRTAEGRNKIVAVNAADGLVADVPTPAWTVISQIGWKPDGSGFFVTATEGRSSISFQIRSLSYPEGHAENITNDLNSYQSLGVTSAGDSFIAARVEQIAYIWTSTVDETGKAVQVTRGIDSYDGIYGLNYLADGSISYEAVPRDGDGEVWRRQSTGALTQLADEGGSMCESPDGRYLILQRSGPDVATGLFKLEPATGKQTRLTTGADVWPTFTPDGRWIVFTRWAEQVALWKVSVDGGDAVKLTDVKGGPTSPTVSPDGSLVAFLWDKNSRTMPNEIGVVSVNGGDVVRTYAPEFGTSMGAGKRGLQWAPDGQGIYFVANDTAGVGNVWLQPVDGSEPVQVTKFDSGRIFNFAFSPDGKNLALSKGSYDRDLVLISGLSKR